MAKRARRGLAELSDSDGDDPVRVFSINSTNSGSRQQQAVSVFDTKVFTDTVLNKIREEEDKVTRAFVETDLLHMNEREPSLLNGSSILLERTAADRHQLRSKTIARRNKTKVLTLISSDEEEDDDCDFTESMMEPFASGSPSTSARSDEDHEHKNSTSQSEVTHEDSFCVLLDDDNDKASAEDDQNDYRVLVKHFGLEETIWVRLKRQDTMQRVFDETSKTVGVSVTLMIDLDGEREEVFPSQTIDDLKLSPDRCTVIFSYPLSDGREHNGFQLKIVTANRRATKQVACRCDESFAAIFQRYCEENSLNREALIFKFDGDVLLDSQTPKDHDMESGEQIEAHCTEEPQQQPQSQQQQQQQQQQQKTVKWETIPTRQLRKR